MNRILNLRTCRALHELKGQQPLTENEYSRLDQMAESCPLAGEHFDEVSWLYPLRIPLEPKVHRLDETSDAVAVVTLFNRNQFVSVIGNQELESSCKAYPGSFLFCVGELEKKIKGDMVFWNLRPRGWKLYPVHECIETGQEKGIKRKKGNNGDK